MYLKFYANHLFVVHAMRIINQQCRITFVYIHKSSDMLNKITLGVKKSEAKKKQHCKWVATYATKSFAINRGQEIIYQNPLSCLNDNSLQCILTTMIDFVTWPPLKVAK